MNLYRWAGTMANEGYLNKHTHTHTYIYISQKIDRDKKDSQELNKTHLQFNKIIHENQLDDI